MEEAVLLRRTPGRDCGHLAGCCATDNAGSCSYSTNIWDALQPVQVKGRTSEGEEITSLQRYGSESSVDSGVTPGECADILLYSQRLRKLADERLSPNEKRVDRLISSGTPIHTGPVPRVRLMSASDCGRRMSPITASTSTASTRSSSSTTFDWDKEIAAVAGGTQCRRPSRLLLTGNGTLPASLSSTPTPLAADGADGAIIGRAPSFPARSNARAQDMPDFSAATTQYRSLRRRKQAIDEGLVWIRRQLDTIEWQNQDMICLLLRNIKELRDIKQTIVSNSAATATDSSPFQKGRYHSFYGQSQFQRQTGSIYRPRLKSKS